MGAHITSELGAPAHCAQILLLWGMDLGQWGCPGNYLRAGVVNRPFDNPGAQTADLYYICTSARDSGLQGDSALQENIPASWCCAINHPKLGG